MKVPTRSYATGMLNTRQSEYRQNRAEYQNQIHVNLDDLWQHIHVNNVPSVSKSRWRKQYWLEVGKVGGIVVLKGSPDA